MRFDPIGGIVPAGWTVGTIGEACDAGDGDVQTGPFGSQLHASDYVPIGIPSIMPQDLKDDRVSTESIARIRQEDAERLARYRVAPGDIVYSRRGDVERRALITAREAGWLCGTGCLRVRLGGLSVDPEFFYYYLGHPAVRGWIVRHAQGATMPNLNTSILRAVPLCYPPRDEQRRIAGVLGALDEKIELNRKMNRTLEEMAQALFKSWFIDFDGHDPADLVDSPLGPIPPGWSAATLGDVLDITMGQSPPGETYNESGEGVPLFQGATDFGLLFPINRIFCTAPTRLAKEWDVLVSVRAPVGRANLAWSDCAVGRGVAALRHPLGFKAFAWCLVGSLHASLDVFNGEGTVFGSINKDALRRITAIKPPNARVVDFESIASPLLQRARVAEFESRTLAELRDTLLPKLISGEVRVPGAAALARADS